MPGPLRRALPRPALAAAAALTAALALTACVPDDALAPGSAPAPAGPGAPGVHAGHAGHAGHGGAPAPADPAPLLEELPTVDVPASAGAGTATGGIFVVLCEPSHRAADDPIVRPGQPGASHLHDFFGNRSTDAMSTTASLQASPDSSCDVTEDESGYWVPAVLRDGQLVEPVELQVYYLHLVRAGRVVAPPPGFRMLAGDATGVADPVVHGQRRLGWSCASDQVGLFAEPPACPPGEGVALRVNFPDCWNGRDLDSPDHRSHVAYSAFDLAAFAAVCPPTHPLPLPALRFNVHYPLDGPDGVALSSGGLETVHGDFLNAWEAPRLAELVAGLNDGGLNPLPGVEDTVQEVIAGLGG